MRKRTSVDVVGAALATALGLLDGCGGAAVRGGGDGGALSGEGGASPSPTTCTAHPCMNPKPVIVANVDTGYDTCAGGTFRRRTVVDCPSLLPRAASSCMSVDAGGPAGSFCTKDTDCAAHPLGYCQPTSTDGPCFCYYGCVRDSDCGSHQSCLCDDPIGNCSLQQSLCSSGADCQPGCDCVQTPANFQCQTPHDTCLTPADCTFADGGACAYCEPGAGGALSCTTGTCSFGRPFLVHGRDRVANTITDSAWACLPSAPERTASRSVLAAAAAHWARVGLMEHASIASFARFTLQLLALGAPPELVRDAQEAMGDETEHARLAFGLASAFAGRPLGPGPLAIDRALDGFDLRDFVATLIREGCVGETVAAIEAREALEHVTDPAVRAVLETIARDDLRHAALAWQVLGWVVASGRADREIVYGEVLRAVREVHAQAQPTAEDEALRAFGVVGEVRRDELRLMAVSSVIGRCATAAVRPPKTGRARPVRVGA
jgi:hypothetical protein